MPTQKIDLPEPLDRFVEDRIRSGYYPEVDSVVRAGLGLLKARTDRDRRKLARLNAAIQVGIDEVERGEVIDVDDLGAWFDAIEAEIDHRAVDGPKG